MAEVASQKIQLAPIIDLPDNDIDSSDWQDISDVTRLNGILRGDETMEISHEGGEYELARDLCERLTKKWRKQRGCVTLDLMLFHALLTSPINNRHRRDCRTRRDRTQQRVDAFKSLLEPMTDAYLGWAAEHDDDKSPSMAEGPLSSDGVWVIDIFRKLHMSPLLLVQRLTPFRAIFCTCYTKALC